MSSTRLVRQKQDKNQERNQGLYHHGCIQTRGYFPKVVDITIRPLTFVLLLATCIMFSFSSWQWRYVGGGGIQVPYLPTQINRQSNTTNDHPLYPTRCLLLYYNPIHNENDTTTLEGAGTLFFASN